jgi:transposase
MLYLGIDQHAKQLTINLRNEAGDVIVKRQVSTEWKRVRQFFASVRRRARGRGFMAIVEICGFNQWLLEMLKEYGCTETVVIQPDKMNNKKTDRRDANALCELLWTNRKRFRGDKRPNGIRRVVMPEAKEMENRQLTALRQHLVRQRTKMINKARSILRKLNLEQECPTKTFITNAAKKWMKELQLESIADRMELDIHLETWKELDEKIARVEKEIGSRSETPSVESLRSIPGVSEQGALTIASRIGDVERFPRPSALANYFGLTPGCRNSGEATARLGSITKAGSTIVRHVLNHAVMHVLRADVLMRRWHKRIKNRRGTKIARVAVMRRLTTIIWHMLKRQEKYRYNFEPFDEPLAHAG